MTKKTLYLLGKEPVRILRKTTVIEGGRRKRVWLCLCSDGTTRWVLYRELIRVINDSSRNV